LHALNVGKPKIQTCNWAELYDILCGFVWNDKIWTENAGQSKIKIVP
jgi:hypothetical protein